MNEKLKGALVGAGVLVSVVGAGIYIANSPTPVSSNSQDNASGSIDQPTNSGVDKDCADFSTQRDAQIYFDAKGGSPNNNVDRLDADNDGIPCETLY